MEKRFGKLKKTESNTRTERSRTLAEARAGNSDYLDAEMSGHLAEKTDFGAVVERGCLLRLRVSRLERPQVRERGEQLVELAVPDDLHATNTDEHTSIGRLANLTIRWSILTCAKKLMSSQLNLPHKTKQKRTRNVGQCPM